MAIFAHATRGLFEDRLASARLLSHDQSLPPSLRDAAGKPGPGNAMAFTWPKPGPWAYIGTDVRVLCLLVAVSMSGLKVSKIAEDCISRPVRLQIQINEEKIVRGRSPAQLGSLTCLVHPCYPKIE